MPTTPDRADPHADRLSRRTFLRGSAVTAGGLVLARAVPAFAAGSGHADTVLRNGYVWTVDGTNPLAEAVAIRRGRIVFVGSNSGAADLVGPHTDVIDLGGKMVMPGIHDGHMHPLSGGRALIAPSLNYAQLTLAEFLDAMQGLIDASSVEEPDGWLRVGQWDAIAMGGLPTREDLDGLSTARPILVHSLDGHIALANSRALALAGITSATADPPDGQIGRDAHGDPNGILYDGAVGLVSSIIPTPTVEQNARSLKAAFDLMAQVGITTYLDANSGTDQLAALAALSDAGDLTVRPNVALHSSAEALADIPSFMGSVESLRQQYGRPNVTINTVKMFLDGVIEFPTQTAAMLNPYRVNDGTDEHPHFVPGDWSGPTYFPQAILNPGVAALDAAGWQVHWHAIGDRAVHSALNAAAFARTRNGRLDNRHTIAHIEAINGHDFGRFHQLGVMANMQMQWAERDTYTMDYLKPYIGAHRWRRLYAAGSLAEHGARVCGGSDWPVDPLLPFRQIEMAVNRTADEVYGGYRRALKADEGLALSQSIEMHTRSSAFQLHQEHLSGTLEVGRQADLVVLDRNLFQVPLTDVSTTQVEMTMVGGKTVHSS